MRIGIEAQRLFRPHKHGMDRVALELIKNLQDIDTENEYFIFVKPDEDNSAIQASSNFNIVEIAGGPYPIWEQVKLPKVAESYKCDVLHCTSNTAPILGKTPVVTTLHDIIYMEGSILNLLRSKASAYQKFGNLYRRFIVSNVVEKSKKLITVSNFEKKNISNYFNLKPTHLQAIYNGVGPQFTTDIQCETLERVKDNHQLPDRYFLHLANKDPRKNTKRVLQAYNDYLNKISHVAPQKLVLLGYSEVDLKAALNELNALECINQIVLPGYVEDADLPSIYRLSELFLFPSLREGFGIPIIEAMACGVPVITSNSSSMPEVAGDAAHIIEPTNTYELVDAMLEISQNSSYRATLISKGLERSKHFTWRTMASKVLQIYKELNHIKN